MATTTTTVWDVISPHELMKKYQSGQPLRLIDVRTPAEFQEIHLPFAENIPLDRFDDAQLVQQLAASNQPMYVICRSGNRAKMACDKLASAGLRQVVLVEGGTLAWAEAGLPVIRGRKVISLERQVRIAAGSLVLIGSVLALSVNVYFALLPALVGAGLIYAGVTDTCGMAMLLARMPWNQAKTSSPKASSGAGTCSA